MKLLHYQPAVPNFGDDLNPMLWRSLAPELIAGDASVQQGEGEAFVGIGTIIGIDPGESRRLHVFSSGAGYSDPASWAGVEVCYHCVRGPVTARLLGLGADRALTDGAILVPRSPLFADLAQPTRGTENGRTVVVPHYETLAFPGWEEATHLAGFDIVDPRGTPRAVIAALARAGLVLTESLHGAILADAFGVPWRGFAVSRNFSTAKWADWTASLGLTAEIAVVPPPDPMPLLRFGKRPEPFGAAVTLDPEVALGEFRARIAPVQAVPFVRRQAKRVLEGVPVTRRLLGFSPERTAQSLSDLAARDPFGSDSARRSNLADEMLERLHRLAKNRSSTGVVTA